MSAQNGDIVRLFQDQAAAETALHARVGLYEAAAVHAVPALMETARSDAHAALDALLDSKERYRRHLFDRWRKDLR